MSAIMNPENFEARASHGTLERRPDPTPGRRVMVASRALIGLPVPPMEHAPATMRQAGERGDDVTVQRDSAGMTALGLRKRDMTSNKIHVPPIEPQPLARAGAGEQ
jgi:hypothetical protein